MKYIGNKTKLIPFIKDCLERNNINYQGKKIIDLFAGTGSVSKFFLKHKCDVISCDNMTYSIAEQYRTNYYSLEPEFEELDQIIGKTKLQEVLEYLNKLDGIEGYCYENYTPAGKYERQYFSNENGKKIDAIREKIESWKSILPYEKYMFLLGILMCSADYISNTSGTYGAYLKIWRGMALKKIKLEKPEFDSEGTNKIIKDDVLNCVKENKNNDIIYLDPPYNSRQYASNFHVLESIVVYDKQPLKGKTGLRNYDSQKSNYCLKAKVAGELAELVKHCDCKYIVMSYSTEGILSKEQILDIMNTRGTTIVEEYNYRRFKTNAWTDGNTELKELLFICEINK